MQDLYLEHTQQHGRGPVPGKAEPVDVHRLTPARPPQAARLFSYPLMHPLRLFNADDPTPGSHRTTGSNRVFHGHQRPTHAPRGSSTLDDPQWQGTGESRQPNGECRHGIGSPGPPLPKGGLTIVGE